MSKENSANKEARKQRFRLTLLASLVIFGILLITMLTSSILMYVLVQTNVISMEATTASPALNLVIFMAIVSLSIGTALTAFTTKIPLRPLNKLVAKMNRLASGDFSTRLSFGKPIKNHPTFVELSESFNKMAEELENTEVLRSDFINNFSHEFKTPIVSIVGFAKLLKRGNLTEEQRAEYLDIIERQSLSLSYMATNVLNLTKIENQTILTDISEFNLSEQLRSCILLLESKWTKKELDLNLEIGEHTICANEELLKQVWINLLDNAIKFSPDYGVIGIHIAKGEDAVKVTISNTGSEISPENQKKIFNKFYQADESHSSEGNGIGLAIVKRITELHGGSVSVKSGNDSTAFTIALPKSH